MIEKKPFGKTAHLSTRLLFGAAAFCNVTDQAIADRTMEVVEQAGINHIDTAAGYGEAEARLGPWLKGNREKVFLATKSDKRTREAALEELSCSLDKMCVAEVDLWQMHFLVDPGEWETAMGEGGALEAFIQAREEGLVRFLGVTGHGVTAPAMLLKSLERFPFDSVLVPYNYSMFQNPAYREDCLRLFRVCAERQVALQVIKTIARGPWEVAEEKRTNTTWYEPLTKAEEITPAVHWALANPQIFLNTPADIEILPRVLKAARSFKPEMQQAELEPAIAALGTRPLFS